VGSTEEAVAVSEAGTGGALLDVRDLRVEFRTAGGLVRAVDGVNLAIRPGEVVAVVGESGSGKSVTALSIMRLLPRLTGRIVAGSVRFDGRDLLALSEDGMRELRGRDIAMIFQEPMTSLNPLLTIGDQVSESLIVHRGASEAEARARAVEVMRLVGIPDAERRLEQYPHQFSGGMRQRVMIAIALVCNPKLIIADEPTTALDVTIQAQILELMKDLCRRYGIALLAITHNLGIVARYADRVSVMYAARQVEEGPAEEIFHRPRHPYTMGLLRAVPRLDRPRGAKLATIDGLPPNLAAAPPGCRFAPRCGERRDICAADPPTIALADDHYAACHRLRDIRPATEEREDKGHAPIAPDGPPLVAVEGLTKHFEVGGGFFRKPALVRAVEDVSFTLAAGETVGLVGESGCGKTTVGRLILKLEDATAGRVVVDGIDVGRAEGSELLALRRRVQVIFQDPYASLNPRMTVGEIVAEPLAVHGICADHAAARERAAALLHQVGLRPEMAARYPHQLSGGQRQRVGIARALAFEPRIIVCDEAVSALDVSIQGQIVNLLEALQRERGLAYLFIAHDLAVVRHISMRVVVMYLGKIMEIADRDALYADPLHPYTRLLLDAAPVPDPVIERARAPRLIQGELPSPLSPPSGCVFHTRCPIADAACRGEIPALRPAKPGRMVACHKV